MDVEGEFDLVPDDHAAGRVVLPGDAIDTYLGEPALSTTPRVLGEIGLTQMGE